MDIRHDSLREIFRGLSSQVDAYVQRQADSCYEDHGDNPTEFYECVKEKTSELRDNMYKFEGLSLYSDLREREGRSQADSKETIKSLAKDVKNAAKELENAYLPQ